MAAETRTFPMYVMRDAELDDVNVHLLLIEAVRSSLVKTCSLIEGVAFTHVSAAHDPVQAQLYPELERDGLCAEMRDDDAVMSPAPFYVEYHVVEITADAMPNDMSLAVFVGPNSTKAYADTDIMEAIECSMYGDNASMPTMASIATGQDGATGLVASVIDAAANHPETDFGGVEYGGLPDKHVNMVINIG